MTGMEQKTLDVIAKSDDRLHYNLSFPRKRESGKTKLDSPVSSTGQAKSNTE